jgi:predicted Zn finger-like uncharacterized protein
MITQCPNCATSFRVTPTQLEVAQGAVRCGACLQVFPADQHMITDGATGSPEPTEEPSTQVEQVPEPTDDTVLADGGTDLDEEETARSGEQINGAEEPVAERHMAQAEEWIDPETTDQADEEEARIEQKAHAEQSPEQPALQSDEVVLETDQDASQRASAEPSEASPEPAQPEPAQPEPASPEPATELSSPEPLTGLPVREENQQTELGDQNVEEDGSGQEAHPDAASREADDEATGIQSSPGQQPLLAEDVADLAPADRLSEDEKRRVADNLTFDPDEEIGAEVQEIRTGRWFGWTLANLLLMVVLGIQFGWFHQAELSQRVELRPWYALLCRRLQCDLADFIDVARIKTRRLVVRSHPDVDQALMVDAIILNDSEFAQPFPLLHLSFSDIESKPVASRHFKPIEYLAGELIGRKRMPAHTEVHLALEIVDPGTAAVSYQLVLKGI